MERIEVDVITGERKVIQLTLEEETAALARTAEFDAQNTLDARAIRAIDSLDRLQFEHLFELENRTRALEANPPITRLQYRNALLNKWKTLNQ